MAVAVSLDNLRKLMEQIRTQPETEGIAHGVFYEECGKILFIGTESRGIPSIIRDAYPGWQEDFQQEEELVKPPTPDTDGFQKMLESTER